MGGVGSGNYYRGGSADTLDATKCIDIRYLTKQGYLNGYASGTLSWNCGGKPCGLINVKHSNNVLTLNYRFRENGGEWQPVEQQINILSTPCHYGGFRKWLECPFCKRRVGILAGADIHFACRHCYKLPYASQQETSIDRVIRAKHKMGERIFDDYQYGEGYRKKKGMHRKTFERLRHKYDLLDMAWNQTMLAYCRRNNLISEASLFDPFIGIDNMPRRAGTNG